MITGLIGSVWCLSKIEDLTKPIDRVKESLPFCGGLSSWHFEMIMSEALVDGSKSATPVGWLLTSDGFWAMQRWIDNPYGYAFVELNLNLEDVQTAICGYVLLPPIDVEEGVLTYQRLQFQTLGIPFFIKK